MKTYDFFYGSQVAEFEGIDPSKVIAKKGIQMSIVGSIYSLKIRPSINKVVVLNVHD